MMELPEFLLEDTPGAIRLRGHRIGLEHIVHFYREGYSAEGIVDEFPSLSLALVHKVIAFYLENREDVDVYAARVRSELDAHAAGAKRGPDIQELRRRFDAIQRHKAS